MYVVNSGGVGGGRDLVYNSSGMNSNLIDRLQIREIKYTIF